MNGRGEKRSNATHPSTPDREARLDKKAKGPEAKWSCLEHVLRENRNGRVVDTDLTLATGPAEGEAALKMIQEPAGGKRVTLGADKHEDTQALGKEWREQGVTPPLAPNNRNRSRASDARTTPPLGDAVRQKPRKRVEEVFGGMKRSGLRRKVRHRGRKFGEGIFTYAAAAYPLRRRLQRTEASAGTAS